MIGIEYVEISQASKNRSIYNMNIASIHDDLEPTMQTCASPGLYYPANTPSEIEAAFDEVLSRLGGQLRLTQ